MEHTLIGVMGTREVWLDGVKLLPDRSQKIKNHSLDGFCWGYGGSGPAQLALAICLELCPIEEEAFWKYQDFKWKVIACLPQSDFEIKFEF